MCLPAMLPACCPVPTDLDKVVSKTDGYSGSDMRHLIQEACQGPVRCAVAEHGAAVSKLCDADLRPVSHCADMRAPGRADAKNSHTPQQ
jgi:hypothetical protein